MNGGAAASTINELRYLVAMMSSAPTELMEMGEVGGGQKGGKRQNEDKLVVVCCCLKQERGGEGKDDRERDGE